MPKPPPRRKLAGTPAPQWITRVVGPITDEQWQAAAQVIDTLPPLTEAQRDRLRLIFRATGKAAS
jgi:hypothetical protein